MTNQEIFDKIATHLIKQGVQSKNEYETCMYRGPNGLMCAAGCLIPDDKYDPKMEDVVWGCFVSPKFPEYENNHDLIRAAQVVHDEDKNWVSESALLCALTQLANDFSLDTSVLASSNA